MKKILYKIVFTLFILSFAGNIHAQLNINHWLNAGREQIDKDNTVAIEYFSKLIKFIPDLDEAYYLRAYSKYSLKDYVGALQDINTAIKIKAANSYYYILRGEIKSRMYNVRGAREDFSKAVMLKATNTEAYLRRGLNGLMLGLNDEAIQDFNIAITLNKNNDNAFLYRGMAYQSKKDYSMALSDFDKAIQLNPFDAENYFRRGRNYLEEKKYNEALADFNHTIKLDSAHTPAYYSRALTRDELKDSLGALIDLNRVLKLDPENALAYFVRAELKVRLKDINGALDDYDKVIEINPNNIYTYFNRGIVYQTLKKYKKAISDYSTAIDLNSNFVAAYYNRSIALRAIGDMYNAEKDYKTAARINKERNEGGLEEKLDSTSLAKIIDFKADFERGNVKESSNSLAGITPAPAYGIVCISKTDFESKKYTNTNVLEKINNQILGEERLIVSNNPIDSISDQLNSWLVEFENLSENENDATRLLSRSVIKAQLQDYNGALSDCDQVIKLKPDWAVAYFLRSYVLFEYIMLMQNVSSKESDFFFIGENGNKLPSSVKGTPDFTQVISDLETSIQHDSSFIYTYFNLANVLVETKAFDKAIYYYSKVIALDPNFAQAYFNRGLLYIFTNKKEEGCSDISKAGELGIKSAYNIMGKYCNEK